MSTQTPTRPYDDDLLARLAHERIVVLSTALDEDTGQRLAAQLFLLSAEDAHTDVTLWISSPGGSVPAMLAVHDVMRLIPNDVRTVAVGMAASAGQFLLSAGTPGKRFAMPHARVLLHQGSAGIGGTAVDVELQADDLRHTRDTVLGLIAQHTGQSVERVREDSLRDRWFTAQEALAYGFVDAVVRDMADVRPADPRRGVVGIGIHAVQA
ncbi:MAG: ATP-dependent Clp protease proteolytic subunit [Cellulomonas sp.]|jgi:ATP-dependent Clp protease, protease subunit|uniref:ClpP family protease n=1 Tax=Cellulomonas sp. TaxID=40001 RepID=UPI0019FFBEB0|nr:ATP-dependent Clp protease proteolytic subunit [Cellulomonas sp.]MBF0689292.1 ATP-dependent Clp protease proteolytic subunit [Cellulomonas sp.]